MTNLELFEKILKLVQLEISGMTYEYLYGNTLIISVDNKKISYNVLYLSNYFNEKATQGYNEEELINDIAYKITQNIKEDNA